MASLILSLKEISSAATSKGRLLVPFRFGGVQYPATLFNDRLQTDPYSISEPDISCTIFIVPFRSKSPIVNVKRIISEITIELIDQYLIPGLRSITIKSAFLFNSKS